MTPQTSQFQYSTPEQRSSPFFDNFYIHDPTSVLHMTNLLTNMPQYLSSNASSLCNNSTSDEAYRQQTKINDRKQRRMASNRESARRSRIRKEKLLEELLSQLVSLRTDNQTLIEQLNQLEESYERAVDENSRLKEEAADILLKLDEIKIANTPTDMQSFVVLN